MDYYPALMLLTMMGGIISLIVATDQPILTALAAAFLGMCVIAILFLIIAELKTGWNDDMLAPYSFLQAMLLCALGIRYLIESERRTKTR